MSVEDDEEEDEEVTLSEYAGVVVSILKALFCFQAQLGLFLNFSQSA